MSKKHKSRYVDHGVKVVAVGEKITFDKKEENHMDKEWFYLNDIVWYKSTDGRTVAPVKGVVKHVGRQGRNSDYVLVSVAEKAIVDAAPFGACYEHDKLMALCARNSIETKNEEQKTCMDEENGDQKSCTDE